MDIREAVEDLHGRIGLVWGNSEQVRNEIEVSLEQLLKEAIKQERQFILNVLDGIDQADREMGNTGGGTRAIRLALQNRI